MGRAWRGAWMVPGGAWVPCGGDVLGGSYRHWHYTILLLLLVSKNGNMIITKYTSLIGPH